MVSHLGEAIRRLNARIEHARVRRHAIRALSALSDRQLEDIGVHRGAIAAFVDRRLPRETGDGVAGNRESAAALGQCCHA